MVTAALGYNEKWLDAEPDTYANLARVAYDGLAACAEDIRAGRQIRGGIKVPAVS